MRRLTATEIKTDHQSVYFAYLLNSLFGLYVHACMHICVVCVVCSSEGGSGGGVQGF